jgi:hypothetical protein
MNSEGSVWNFFHALNGIDPRPDIIISYEPKSIAWHELSFGDMAELRCSAVDNGPGAVRSPQMEADMRGLGTNVQDQPYSDIQRLGANACSLHLPLSIGATG